MTPPIEVITSKTDKRGDYMTPPVDGRRVVLKFSKNKPGYKPGEEVDYEITSEGDYVDFSNDHRLVTEPQQSSNPETNIETVFWDPHIGSILVVGDLPDPNVVKKVKKHFGRGRICDRDYALTSPRALGVHTVDDLATYLDINPEKIRVSRYKGGDTGVRFLDYAWATQGNSLRGQLEELIRGTIG